MTATFNERLLRKMGLLLLIIAVALLDFVSSYTTTTDICYGGNYEAPIYYTPPLFTTSIYFKPRGKQKILAVSDGKSVLKRFVVYTGNIKLTSLTEQDDGAMIYFGQTDIVRLNIEDCQNPQNIFYGELFSWRIPSYTEYIEFSHLTSSGNALEPVVIWNRTDASSGSRGTVKRNYFEINSAKQKDSGYYKCLSSKGDLMKWRRLEVQENHLYEATTDGDDLNIELPAKFSGLSRILFTSRYSGEEEDFDIRNMDRRMKVTERHFFIREVRDDDAGIYKFIDTEGFMALQLELEVDYPQLPGWVYFVGIAVIVLFLICCCCCVKKCCCKKSSNKRSSTETDAPPVFYHDSNQPTQPVVPLLSREPRITHPTPPTYNSAIGNTDLPPPTQITVPGGLERTATPVFETSTDSGPRFEFKGAVFPSAPPLSSGSDIQDVYTSDKLNFL